MQYPAGTAFLVNKQYLQKASLAFKHFFKDGVYTIFSIRKNNDKICYKLQYNKEIVTLEFNSCSEIDRLIAFCKNEVYREPTEIISEF